VNYILFTSAIKSVQTEISFSFKFYNLYVKHNFLKFRTLKEQKERFQLYAVRQVYFNRLSRLFLPANNSQKYRTNFWENIQRH
jgi:hypothetical protein